MGHGSLVSGWSFMEASKESPRENLEVGFWPHEVFHTLVESAVVMFYYYLDARVSKAVVIVINNNTCVYTPLF